ncbi:hypothetical protein SS50377_27512 [Spironucleus salmonicida]|uniref:Uncharacterized protein n=1 Tax=Spironucleus salmonicida TaxID=348837 RepID=V6LQN7_9EUKA|nr:hypothetical protein SS50377_27512 [Spironucleus salmonicida]|eukprot:EST46895.1 hypothetical protein SS50377_13048 [Spironucleus salmonicida]
MKLTEISLQYFPPKIIATCSSQNVTETFQFPIPRACTSAKEIFNYLISQNKLFSIYKKEAKHFAKQLAQQNAKTSKFKLRKVYNNHVSPVVQIAISRQNKIVSIGQDCVLIITDLTVAGSANTQLELDSRPLALAENGEQIAVTHLSKYVKIYDFTAKFLFQTTTKSTPIGVYFNSSKDLFISCFDGSVFSFRNDQKLLVQKHQSSVLGCFQYSNHKYLTASLDGTVLVADIRVTRLNSAKIKAPDMSCASACTSVACVGKSVICGFENGEWKADLQAGSSARNQENTRIRAVSLTVDGEMYAVADENGVKCNGKSLQISGVTQLLFLNPSQHQKLIVAAEKLTIWNVEKDTKTEFACGNISFIAASYDGSTVAVGNYNGEIHILSDQN